MSAYGSNLEGTVVPEHSGTVENETADEMAAADALTNTVAITTVPCTDLKPHIKQLR